MDKALEFGAWQTPQCRSFKETREHDRPSSLKVEMSERISR